MIIYSKNVGELQAIAFFDKDGNVLVEQNLFVDYYKKHPNNYPVIRFELNDTERIVGVK